MEPPEIIFHTEPFAQNGHSANATEKSVPTVRMFNRDIEIKSTPLEAMPRERNVTYEQYEEAKLDYQKKLNILWGEMTVTNNDLAQEAKDKMRELEKLLEKKNQVASEKRRDQGMETETDRLLRMKEDATEHELPQVNYEELVAETRRKQAEIDSQLAALSSPSDHSYPSREQGHGVEIDTEKVSFDSVLEETKDIANLFRRQELGDSVDDKAIESAQQKLNELVQNRLANVDFPVLPVSIPWRDLSAMYVYELNNGDRAVSDRLGTILSDLTRLSTADENTLANTFRELEYHVATLSKQTEGNYALGSVQVLEDVLPELKKHFLSPVDTMPQQEHVVATPENKEGNEILSFNEALNQAANSNWTVESMRRHYRHLKEEILSGTPVGDQSPEELHTYETKVRNELPQLKEQISALREAVRSGGMKSPDLGVDIPYDELLEMQLTSLLEKCDSTEGFINKASTSTNMDEVNALSFAVYEDNKADDLWFALSKFEQLSEPHTKEEIEKYIRSLAFYLDPNYHEGQTRDLVAKIYQKLPELQQHFGVSSPELNEIFKTSEAVDTLAPLDEANKTLREFLDKKKIEVPEHRSLTLAEAKDELQKYRLLLTSKVQEWNPASRIGNEKTEMLKLAKGFRLMLDTMEITDDDDTYLTMHKGLARLVDEVTNTAKENRSDVLTPREFTRQYNELISRIQSYKPSS